MNVSGAGRGRTGTMIDEIYERLYGGTGEIVAEVTEPVADEEVIEEKEAEKQFIEEIEEQEFPIQFAEPPIEFNMQLSEIQESTEYPVTPIDFSALSFAVVAGVGIYMARKKH